MLFPVAPQSHADRPQQDNEIVNPRFFYGLVAAGGMSTTAVNARPTDASYERFRELQAQADEILNRLQEIFDTDVAAFNELLQQLNLAPVVVKQERRVGGISD